MGSLWPFMYTVAFGLTAAYYAKRMRKNPYLWFSLGCFCKIYTPFVIIFSIFIKSFIKYLVLKKLKNSFNFQSHTRKAETKTENIREPSFSFPKEESPLFWYYLTEDKQTKGPVSSLGLQQLQKEGTIGEGTLVWNENFENWTPFNEAFGAKV